MKNLIPVFLLLAQVGANAQPTYMNIQVDYNQQWQTSGRNMVELDSLYLVCMSSGTPFPNTSDTAFVLKINKFNQSTRLDTIYFFKGQRSINMLDIGGELWVRGSHFDGYDDVTSTDIYFCRYNPDTGFDTASMHSYGLPGRGDYLYRPIPTSDGGFFATGWSFEPQGRSSIILFKCDSNLNQQYFNLFPPATNQNYYASGAVELPDKGIMIVGNKWANGENKCDALIAKIDTAGQIAWLQYKYFNGDITQYSLIDIIPKADGSYLAVGARRYDPDIGPAYESYWVVSIDLNGNILWERHYQQEYYAGWQSVTPSQDGNFLACGIATTLLNENTGEYVQYAVISKLSPNGDLIWHRKYNISPPGTLYDNFMHVIATSDGGILCCGTTYENDTTHQNVWVVKLDAYGCLDPGPECSTDTNEPLVLPVGANSWISISPNPCTGPVRIAATDQHRLQALRVFDTAGRSILALSLDHETETSIDLGSAPPGTYVFSILVDGVWTVRQVVKQ